MVRKVPNYSRVDIYGEPTGRDKRSFSASYLPEAEKLELARSLLAEFGVSHVSQRGHELIHSCPLPFGAHKNGDKSPSASLNYDKLTFNCLGCGSSGGLLWFIGVCRGESVDETRSWLDVASGLTDDEEGLSALLRYFDAIYSPEAISTEPIPKMATSVLNPWKKIHPWVTEVRRIPEETVMKFSVGYGKFRLLISVDPETFVESERIILPHFWKGDLVGWQTRRLDAEDGTPKYSSSPSFPKDVTLFNHGVSRTPLVVESMFSSLSKHHLTPDITATFGAKVTDTQLKILSKSDSVTLWMDNDEAGWKSTVRCAEMLEAHCPVFVVPSPYNADPADLDDATYLDLLSKKTPYSLWTPPSGDLVDWVYPQ